MAKVTSFITRPAPGGPVLLLIEHPFAGIQIPAGTVEAGETPEAAAQREAREETGREGFTLRAYLGQMEERLPDGERVLLHEATVYSRPDQTSFDWARLRRGITVGALRQQANFTQVEYVEYEPQCRTPLRDAANHRLGAGLYPDRPAAAPLLPPALYRPDAGALDGGDGQPRLQPVSGPRWMPCRRSSIPRTSGCRAGAGVPRHRDARGVKGHLPVER
jgi:8-oxo-dGTP pyrophosphatase MutT (NUDIX family)